MSPVVAWIRRGSLLVIIGLSVWFGLVQGTALVREFALGPNLSVRQAAAFLQGRLDVPRPGWDLADYDGRSYVPFPPGPALLFLPVVAITGEQAPVAQGVCLVLALLSVWLLLVILKRLGIPPAQHGWLLAAFFLGSGYWSVLSLTEGVWHSALIVAVTALLLALTESLHRARPWLVGMWIGLAFLSRQFTILSTIGIGAIMLATRRRNGQSANWRAVLQLAVPIGAAIAVYLAFNYWRFGDPLDTGYIHIPVDGYEQARRTRYGLFSLAYVPINLFRLLVQGFHLSFDPSTEMIAPQPDWFGTSLPAASPFIVLAFFAPSSIQRKPVWAAVVLTAILQSLYYVNGAGQLNWQRYALDYWPLLFVLIALGFHEVTSRSGQSFWKGTIVYALLLNALVVAYFKSFAWFLSAWPKLFVRHL